MRKVVLFVLISLMFSGILLAQGPFPTTIPLQGRLVKQVGGNATGIQAPGMDTKASKSGGKAIPSIRGRSINYVHFGGQKI